MVLAPHPDDESLATGGLIQRAVRLGAEVRVIFASDGDNNPWPQRYLDRRWSIGPQERAQWGARRRAEAIAALRCFGVGEEAIRFLGWPDQGNTRALLQAEEEPIALLAGEFESWRPTLLAAPSLHDIHPDHNAIAVQLRLALARCTVQPALLRYLVHHRAVPARDVAILSLTDAELMTKRAAILRHETQMALSRRRFLAYAQPAEAYYTTDAAPPAHPLHSAHSDAGALAIEVDASVLLRSRLHIAFESFVEGSVRWSLTIPRFGGRARLRDARTGAALREATVRVSSGRAQIRIPLAPVVPLDRVFVKYESRLAFYDSAGWREVPVLAEDAAPCPALSPSATSFSSSSSAPSSSGGVSVGLD